jgi:hypothetical protein
MIRFKQKNIDSNNPNKVITYYWQRPSAGPDPDATAFLTAAGITDATISVAINTLVIQLKAIGIWTKMKAIYPFVGGTATTHKFNLKNPADTDAAFRLSFVGGWVHSANGIFANGINTYGDTKLNGFGVLTPGTAHLMVYQRTLLLSVVGNPTDIGGITTGPNIFTILSTFNSGGLTYFGLGDAISSHPNISATSNGFFLTSREDISTTKLYRNASLLTTKTIAFQFFNTNNMFIGARNTIGSPTDYAPTGVNYAFASIGDGLTTTEAANYYTAVQSFQTTLGRQV